MWRDPVTAADQRGVQGPEKRDGGVLRHTQAQQVSLHGRGVNLEWNGVEPGHETRESGRLGNEAMSPQAVPAPTF